MKNGNERMSNLVEIEKWKKRAQEAEGELTIIKGIGNTSPEMKNLKLEMINANKVNDARFKEIEALKSQLALDKEDAQVQILRLEKINNEHQKTNGELQVRLSQYEDKAAHYRRKAVL